MRPRPRRRPPYRVRLRQRLTESGVTEESLKAIRHWHVAVTGSLYALPLAESVPDAAACFIHAALPLWIKRQEARARPTATKIQPTPIAVSVHASEDHLPQNPNRLIASVFLERSLLQRLWQAHGEDLPDTMACLAQGQAVTLGHWSCHGTHDIENPSDSALILRDAQGQSRRWTARDILRSTTTPDTAILSACLAGRFSQDSEGDPMGITAALQLRTTQTVIGALVRVPDGGMTWFSTLLHWHLKQNLAPREALTLTVPPPGAAPKPAMVPLPGAIMLRLMLAVRAVRTRLISAVSGVFDNVNEKPLA